MNYYLTQPYGSKSVDLWAEDMPHDGVPHVVHIKRLNGPIKPFINDPSLTNPEFKRIENFVCDQSEDK
jgi:hypothetical protein